MYAVIVNLPHKFIQVNNLGNNSDNRVVCFLSKLYSLNPLQDLHYSHIVYKMKISFSKVSASGTSKINIVRNIKNNYTRTYSLLDITLLCCKITIFKTMFLLTVVKNNTSNKSTKQLYHNNRKIYIL